MDLNASILVDTIILLLNENSETTRDLANQLIVLFKEAKVVDSDDSDVIRFYIRILHRIINEQVDKRSIETVRTLLLKLKSEPVFASHKEHLLDIEKTLIVDSVMSANDRDKAKRAIRTVIRINNYDKKIKRAFGRIQHIKDIDSLDARYEELKDFETKLAEDINSMTSNNEDSGYDGPKAQDSISSKDIDALTSAFTLVHEARTTGAIKSGRRGFNKMFGEAGGLPGGSSYCLLAPSHHGKSFHLLDWAYWGPAYNNFKPKGKLKPLVYLASTENGARENYMILYSKIHLELTGEKAPPVRMTDGVLDTEEIKRRVTAVSDFFEKNGTELLVEFYAAHEFGALDFVSRLRSLMSEGYYIPLAIFDYLAKSKMPNAAREDIAIGTAYNIVSTFAKHHGIVFATGHQYTREGCIKLEGKFDKVKSMNMGGVKGGADAFQIVDILVNQYLETSPNGVQYVTNSLIKYRYESGVSPADRYCAYAITDGGIKDDLNDAKSRAVSDIYSEGMDVSTGYNPKGQKIKEDELF